MDHLGVSETLGNQYVFLDRPILYQGFEDSLIINTS